METKDNNQYLLAFYGDDFTGSTDAMEALAAAGYRTILFTEPPTKEKVEKFQDVKCIGFAGTGRAKVPKEMEAELTPVYNSLSKLGAPIIHYKTCSTFDSSPEVGSIGHAIKVAQKYFNDSFAVPLLVAAPALGRYTVFGQHFARMQDTVYRLDRHPVMSKHPVTPMNEADLEKHLKRQIEADVGLLDINELHEAYDDVVDSYNKKNLNHDILLLDSLSGGDMERIGSLLWEQRHKKTSQFVVGSSGVEYALTSYWEKSGVTKSSSIKDIPNVVAKNNILVVSGSVSVITQEQIETAISNGFHGMNIPVELFTDNGEPLDNFLQEAIDLLNAGESVMIYTALGPNDHAVAATKEHLKKNGIDKNQAGEFIGRKLGRWTKDIVRSSGIDRVVLAGGDTSGFITKELGVYGLEMIQQISPGAPLCRAYSEDERMNGIELALKGGQLGSVKYFEDIRNANA